MLSLNLHKWFWETSEADALRELDRFMPDSEFRIEHLDDGRVRIGRNNLKLTVRPNLHEAMAVVRWYYKEYAPRADALTENR